MKIKSILVLAYSVFIVLVTVDLDLRNTWDTIQHVFGDALTKGKRHDLNMGAIVPGQWSQFG